MGDNTIHYLGHVKMMGAVQPFISGAISKTVNMPEDATIEDVENLHMDAWRLGVKAVAIYRDNCKVGQPLSTAKKDGEESSSSVTATDSVAAELYTKIDQARGRARTRQVRRAARPGRRRCASACRVVACRRRSPSAWRTAKATSRWASTRTVDPARCSSRSPSRVRRWRASWTPSRSRISLGLQHGVPLATYVRKYVNMKFEPSGMTDDADLRIATSLVDYIFRRLALDYLSPSEREELGVLSTSERIQPTLPEVAEQATPTVGVERPADVRRR